MAAAAPEHDRVRAARAAGVRARLLRALWARVGAEDQDRVGRERHRAGGSQRGFRLVGDLALLDLSADEEQHEREREPGADRERDPQQHAPGGDAAVATAQARQPPAAPRAAGTAIAASARAVGEQLVEARFLAAEAFAQPTRLRAIARVGGVPGGLARRRIAGTMHAVSRTLAAPRDVVTVVCHAGL